MKNIVYFGSKKIGHDCLRILYDKQFELNYKIIGVVASPRGNKIKKFCKDNNLNTITLDQYCQLPKVDIGISVQYHKILKPIHINKVKEIIINLHMAPLPEYRGCNQFSYAIINNDSEFGTSIHRLEEGIDSGAILFENRFDIPENCWIDELYELTYQKSVELFNNKLKDIITGEYKLIKQEDLYASRGTSIHYRREINELKKIDLNWNRDKIERHIRGTLMPGFEPPFAMINDEKIYFSKE